MRKFFSKLFGYIEISNFERGGLLALLFSLVVFSSYYYFKNSRSVAVVELDEEKLAAFRSQVDSAFAKREFKIKEFKNSKNGYKKNSDLKLFNPNLDTEIELVEKGVPSYVASGIVRFTRAGGRFKFKQDVEKIYAIDEDMFTRLEPFINLPSYDSNYASKEVAKEPVSLVKSETKSQSIDINKASIDELKKISGIGNFYATQIVKYRDKLGGYRSKDQLLEVYKMRKETVAELGDIFIYNQGLIKIPINTATFKQLLSHPYLDYNQVKAIVNFREQHGAFSQLSDIENIHIFKGKDISRLLPYLDLN